MQCRDGLAGDGFQLAKHPVVAERQAVQHAAHQLPRRLRPALPRLLTELLDRRAHAGGIEEALIVGVDKVGEGPGLLGLCHQGGEAQAGPQCLQPLHQPEPHDVLEQTPGALHPSFVGQVGRLCGLVGDRGLALDPDQ
ncbi:hypothetical protein D3C72_2089550 [compost metagenome]